MKDFSLWKFISNKIKTDEHVILISVLESQGSSPGKAGFKMAVAADNEFIGTIGGGEMENNIVVECRNYLSKKRKIRIHKKLYHNKKVNKPQSGLICAGTQSLFIYSFDKDDLSTIAEIIKIYDANSAGIFCLSQEGISFDGNSLNKNTINYDFENEKSWNYEENIGVLETIYIIGGGHVGLALAKQMDLLGFYIVLFDDRKDIPTIKENIYADEIIITGFENVGGYIKEGGYSYAAVVTASHLTDKIVVDQIINKKLKYIGLMGSAAKRKKVFDELMRQGVSENKIRKIHSPIGININSETVSEIAVSIAAEIIKRKNKRRQIR